MNTAREQLSGVLQRLDEDGYAIVADVFGPDEIVPLAERLTETLENRDEASVLRSRGRAYGSRNLLETVPEVARLPSHLALRPLLEAVLGPSAGIVRVLFFDKPPKCSWSLPWHRDETIAVQRNDLESALFRNPTIKAGVPHVQAPVELLKTMLTARVHLDAMTADNGPLLVIPGSHHITDKNHRPPVELHAGLGDVLLMRPLLSHSSRASALHATSHRRVIHFELAPSPTLPDGYEWHTFLPLEGR